MKSEKYENERKDDQKMIKKREITRIWQQNPPKRKKLKHNLIFIPRLKKKWGDWRLKGNKNEIIIKFKEKFD